MVKIQSCGYGSIAVEVLATCGQHGRLYSSHGLVTGCTYEALSSGHIAVTTHGDGRESRGTQVARDHEDPISRRSNIDFGSVQTCCAFDLLPKPLSQG
eukprot:45473-Eustigmatos_ZCMA.PRE.1